MNNTQAQTALTSYGIDSQCIRRHINHKNIYMFYVIILGLHIDTFWKPFYLLCLYSQNIYGGKDVTCVYNFQQILDNFSSGVLTYCWK